MAHALAHVPRELTTQLNDCVPRGANTVTVTAANILPAIIFIIIEKLSLFVGRIFSSLRLCSRTGGFQQNDPTSKVSRLNNGALVLSIH